ncbi:MAG: hypothetical protein E6G35_02520 [Actinobacteria bacterium]|nr:MAG: hypothetical protein E6G35_02520 [Actinomycetota bacterium]
MSATIGHSTPAATSAAVSASGGSATGSRKVGSTTANSSRSAIACALPGSGCCMVSGSYPPSARISRTPAQSPISSVAARAAMFTTASTRSAAAVNANDRSANA